MKVKNKYIIPVGRNDRLPPLAIEFVTPHFGATANSLSKF